MKVGLIVAGLVGLFVFRYQIRTSILKLAGTQKIPVKISKVIDFEDKKDGEMHADYFVPPEERHFDIELQKKDKHDWKKEIYVHLKFHKDDLLANEKLLPKVGKSLELKKYKYVDEFVPTFLDLDNFLVSIVELK